MEKKKSELRSNDSSSDKIMKSKTEPGKQKFYGDYRNKKGPKKSVAFDT